MYMAIKLGVIGCGYWGPNLIRNFSQIDSIELCYVCDIDEKKVSAIKKTYPNVKTVLDYKDVLRDPEVDAIVIALPVKEHYRVARDSLLSNKHILIEKPMTSNSKEAEDLIKIGKEKNKIIMIDHTFEYDEAINKMKEIIESKDLGEIYYIRAEWLNLGLLQPDINVVWDLATHMASIINYALDIKPVSLNANVGAYIRKDIPEVANINIKFPGDVNSYITVSWLEPKKTRRITIAGSKKLLIYDLMNEEEKIKVYDKGVDLLKDVNDVRQFKINYRYGDIYSPNIKNIEPLKNVCSHFADCIKNNKTPRSNGESGLEVIKILEAIDESLKNNGKEVFL